MRAMSKRKYLILASLVFFIMALLPSGCSPEGRELAISFLREWAVEKDIDPGTTTGKLNIAMRVMGGSTGDEAADAAIDGGRVIKNLVDADKLMDEGRESGDIGKVDEAIEMRPGDWTYRVSKSNIFLRQGDRDSWGKEFMKALEIAEKDNNKNTEIRFYEQYIDELEQMRIDLEWNGYKDNNHKFHIYDLLGWTYLMQYELTGNPEYQARGDSHYAVANDLKGKL